LFSH
jgi:hypothetical protein